MSKYDYALKELPEIVVDQDAFTTAELAQKTARKPNSINIWMAAQIESGKWERVSKRVNGRLLPAYRPSQKQRKP